MDWLSPGSEDYSRFLIKLHWEESGVVFSLLVKADTTVLVLPSGLQAIFIKMQINYHYILKLHLH